MSRRWSRQDFLDDLARIADSLRRKTEAEVDGFEVDPAASRQRRDRAQSDFGFFARTYFPHYTKYSPSLVHDWIMTALPAALDHPRGRRIAFAAPRGEAKSTLVTQILVLWAALTGRKRYIVIGADAFDQAAMMLVAIKAELESNARIAMDYPDGAGVGRVWREGVILSKNEVKIEIFGSGKRMRGKRHGPYRPDLVVCDDLENDENVRSPEQRDKLHEWLNKTVLNLGPADGTMDAIVVGTVLHYDSVLARLLRDPLWVRRKFQAVVEWPHQMDLWEHFAGLLRAVPDSEEVDGEEIARAYYLAHKAEMDEGAVVSWPSCRPLVDLMIKRAVIGNAAFDAEQQNDPAAGEGAPFAGAIHYWTKRDPEWVFVGACDPSMGLEGRGRDPSAILVGGFHRGRGELCVVEALIIKRPPDRIIEEIIALQRRYHCLVWVVETVQFQEMFRQELLKRSVEAGVPVPARGVKPTADKALRIESLQPFMAAKRILLHPSQTTLIDQLRHFPKADHDDGPDALHMLWMAATTMSGGYTYKPISTDSGRRFAAGRWGRNQEED